MNSSFYGAVKAFSLLKYGKHCPLMNLQVNQFCGCQPDVIEENLNLVFWPYCYDYSHIDE